MQFHLSAILLALGASSVIALPNPAPEMTTDLAKRIDHFGRATVFTQDGGTGSCGNRNPDSAHIVALSNRWMQNQSPSSFCGRKVQVKNTGSPDGAVHGKNNVIIATVADTCPGCGDDDIDFSVGSWNQLTNNSPFSVADITWHFCNINGQC